MELYECEGKGGRYELLGPINGAGTLRGVVVNGIAYRSVETGEIWVRQESDFNNRMVRVKDGQA